MGTLNFSFKNFLLVSKFLYKSEKTRTMVGGPGHILS